MIRDFARGLCMGLGFLTAVLLTVWLLGGLSDIMLMLEVAAP